LAKQDGSWETGPCEIPLNPTPKKKDTAELQELKKAGSVVQ